MADWSWPWARRARSQAETDAMIGQMRQEDAAFIATVRQGRRSLEAAILQAMATQAERGEEHDG